MQEFVDLAGNANKAPTTASTTTHTQQGRPSSAYLQLPLQMHGGVFGGCPPNLPPPPPTMHTQGRPSSAKPPIVWLCNGWPPLCMYGGASSGWGLLCVSSQAPHCTAGLLVANMCAIND